ncbi:MAG: hypothetical protein IPK07_32800 [Deltaproteobacteria bacterium]|nr:hypothetical protein [Deltaproteobacteria bacterium]
MISCGSKCVSPYSAGSLVQLTAKASSGSVFAGWTGLCTGTASTCTVSVSGHADVGAVFTAQPKGGGGGGGGGGKPTTYRIGVTTKGKGTVASSPSAASYAAGTSVTLTRDPRSRSALDRLGRCLHRHRGELHGGDQLEPLGDRELPLIVGRG